MDKKIILEKVVSEKSFAKADQSSVYTFYISPDAKKLDVKNAIEKEYKVKVVSVNTITRPGKMKRVGKKYIKKRFSDRKKAVVTLKNGDLIKDFTKI